MFENRSGYVKETARNKQRENEEPQSGYDPVLDQVNAPSYARSWLRADGQPFR